MKLSVKGSYLYLDEKPFFWQGDTAWLMLDRLSMDDIKKYLRNRYELGYNVIQSVLIYSLPDQTLENGMACGKRNPYDIKYYDFVKEVLDYAKQFNMFLALLPCWGHFVKNGTVNENNAKEFGEFLGNYFKDYDNIIWVVGGDVRGDVNFKCFDTLGKALKACDDTKLVTFHPFGRTGSYLWFNDCSWLDFNMFQSGHRRYDQLTLGAWDDKAMNEDSFGEDNYKYVLKNNTYKIKKPCLDAEPSYEGIVQGLHDNKEPYWEARHVRRYAYWSLFEGACGFTYGNNAIIQFYNFDDKPSYGVRESWYDALHSEGGMEIQYLKDLMLEFDYTNGKAMPELILNQSERHHRTSCFVSKKGILCYTYKGDKVTINLESYKNTTFDIYYMNPQNGARSYDSTIKGQSNITLRPTRRRELSNDWVIILKALGNE